MNKLHSLVMHTLYMFRHALVFLNMLFERMIHFFSKIVGCFVAKHPFYRSHHQATPRKHVQCRVKSKQKRVNTSAWRRCINRLKVFYKEFILKISTVTVFLRYVLPSFILFNIRLNQLSSSPVTSLSGWREMETKRGHIQLVATCLRE